MTGKTKKALLKRIKVTGRGKLLHRHTRQNHFNAKQSGMQTMQKRQTLTVAKNDARAIRARLPH